MAKMKIYSASDSLLDQLNYIKNVRGFKTEQKTIATLIQEENIRCMNSEEASLREQKSALDARRAKFCFNV